MAHPPRRTPQPMMDPHSWESLQRAVLQQAGQSGINRPAMVSDTSDDFETMDFAIAGNVPANVMAIQATEFQNGAPIHRQFDRPREFTAGERSTMQKTQADFLRGFFDFQKGRL